MNEIEEELLELEDNYERLMVLSRYLGTLAVDSMTMAHHGPDNCSDISEKMTNKEIFNANLEYVCALLQIMHSNKDINFRYNPPKEITETIRTILEQNRG